jgi:glycosyltransferase involved in cell wall biosynthesis
MNKKILILLSTYNGEKYLQEQLDSLFAQTYKEFEIIARDDGSCDNSLEILKACDVTILDSKENLGAKGSFGALLEFAVEKSSSDYFMFCDQDDVWESDKIEKSLLAMQEMEKAYLDTPLLVHTDLKVVDEKLLELHNSFWEYEYIMPQYNSLNRLLMQNTITGCTMMINRKLATLSLPIPEESIMHDWWLGLVASKFGAIKYVKESTLQYRQHGGNTIGAKGFSYSTILKKGLSIFFNRNLYMQHLNVNVAQAKAFLEVYSGVLDQNTQQILEDFVNIEQKTFFQKRKIILKHGLLKQGLIRNIGLMAKI